MVDRISFASCMLLHINICSLLCCIKTSFCCLQCHKQPTVMKTSSRCELLSVQALHKSIDREGHKLRKERVRPDESGQGAMN